MKQFNLKEYLKDPNKKVVTRDGRNVRIICTDRQGGDYPILALCFESDGIKHCFSCLPNGRRYVDIDSCLDLFFAPEKRSGWINIYDRTENAHASRRIYDTEEEALKCASVERVDTIKIEWEE